MIAAIRGYKDARYLPYPTGFSVEMTKSDASSTRPSTAWKPLSNQTGPAEPVRSSGCSTFSVEPSTPDSEAAQYVVICTTAWPR